MPTEIHPPKEARKTAENDPSGKTNSLRLLRRLGKAFIWFGAIACGAHLLLAVPSISSLTHALVIVIETVGRLSATVGLGGVLLALAEIADGVRDVSPRVGSPTNSAV
jgi:hypothetical protein